jgi:integrative and conjugative element protein (TIGR02256 family)
MLEDQARELRLRDIEAQYYASLLADDWGRAHLGARVDQMRVGAGCRDASVVLSLEHIQLFGATLARQLRTLTHDSMDAHLRMWRVDAVGGVECKIVELTGAIYAHYGRWTIASYRGLDRKLRRLRDEKLPVETGGVIVGYIDHQSRTVFVVDVLRAPPDSKESADGFIRGKDGLKEAVDDVATRTMKMVRYIGDWHSHPPRASTAPSWDDRLLSAHLASELAADGDPALMIIVGDVSTRYVLSEVF